MSTQMMTDTEILARTVWGEARGETLAGQIAVAHTIMNRVLAPGWWGTSVRTVCLKPHQFSCWNYNDPNYPYVCGRKTISIKELDPLMDVAQSAISGVTDDPTRGANHYYSTLVFKDGAPPAWAKNMKQMAVIGHHVFLKG